MRQNQQPNIARKKEFLIHLSSMTKRRGKIGGRMLTQPSLKKTKFLSPLGTSLVMVPYFVSTFVIVAALLFASSTSVIAKEQQPPLEPGQRVHIIAEIKEISGATHIYSMPHLFGTVVQVDSTAVTLQVEKPSDKYVGTRLVIPLEDIKWYEVIRAQELVIAIIAGLIVVLVPAVLLLIVFLRTTREQRRKMREESMRNTKLMTFVGGAVGLVVGFVLIAVINALFDMDLDKWGVGIMGGDATIPLSFALLFICISLFGMLFHARAKRRRDMS